MALAAERVGWRLPRHPWEWFAPGDREPGVAFLYRCLRSGQEKDKGRVALGSCEQKGARTQRTWGTSAHVTSSGTQTLVGSWRPRVRR